MENFGLMVDNETTHNRTENPDVQQTEYRGFVSYS